MLDSVADKTEVADFRIRELLRLRCDVTAYVVGRRTRNLSLAYGI